MRWRRSRRLEVSESDKGKGAGSGSKGEGPAPLLRSLLLEGNSIFTLQKILSPLPNPFSTDFSSLSLSLSSSSYLNGYLFWQQKIIVWQRGKRDRDDMWGVRLLITSYSSERWEKHIIQHLFPWFSPILSYMECAIISPTYITRETGQQ